MPAIPSISRNGKHQEPESAGTVGPVNRISAFIDEMEPVLAEAHEQHKDDPVTGLPEEKSGPVPDVLTDLRALAMVLSTLQHDSPERRELLRLAGLEADALSPRQLSTLGKYLLDEIDRRASEGCEMAWEKLPCPGRDEGPPSLGLNTRRLSEVAEREVEWLWPNRLPLGKLAFLNGDPDLGKSWLLLDVMSRITTGRAFPDGAPNPFGNRRDVLWVSAEDEDEDTVRPRLRMLGADLTRVHSLAFVLYEGKQRTMSLGDHLDWLDRWLWDHPEVVLVGVDPFAAFLGRVDSHRNADVRQLLTPVSRLASRHRVGIVGVNHLAKGDGGSAMYRGIGSIAFVAAARSSWLVTRDPQEPDRRLFTKIKNNLSAEDVGGLAFRVGKAHNGITWETGAIQTTADEALAVPDRSRAPALAEAKDWLRDLLRERAVPAGEVQERAKADGMCWRTVKTAKKELGVLTEKTGGKGAGWVWSLPKK